jgi:hypothetical protein
MNKNMWIAVGSVLFILAVVLYAWSNTGRVSRIEAGLGDLGLQVSGIEEKTIDNFRRAIEAYEKADLLAGRVEVIEEDIDYLITSDDEKNSAITSLSQGLGVVEGRIGRAETAIEAVTQTAKTAQKEAQRSNAQHSARIQTENRQYLRMVNYIREKNSGFEVAQKSDEEIVKLLTNGVWDIEDPIKEEYDRLIASTAQAGLIGSMTAYDRAEEAKQTAEIALTTGEAVTEAVTVIVEQPNRFWRHSVTRETKRKASSLLSPKNR